MGTQCKAKSKQSGERCKNYAVRGREVCSIHGGKSLQGIDSATFKHGRYIKQLNARLRERLAELETDDPLDLHGELDVQRVVFAEYISRFVPGVPLTALDITYINNWTSDIGRTVERIVKIRNEDALTSAEVKFLQARILDVLTKFLPDPDQQSAFVAELFGLRADGQRTPELVEGAAGDNRKE